MKDIKAVLNNHIRGLCSNIKSKNSYHGFRLDLNETSDVIGLGGTALGLIMFKLDDYSDHDQGKQAGCAKFIAERQESNGSWTIEVFRSQNVYISYATCYALEALLIYNISDDSKQYKTNIENGINWIIANQNSDGGWGLHNDRDSHIHSTSEVLNLFFFIKQYYPQYYGDF
ncbi:hypothetical protein AGMMS49525_17670 [Bacteroidia bacterium]|nr:hypothetical protein AGMMS49525_17670 [Bacteroidia bacterium]